MKIWTLMLRFVPIILLVVFVLTLRVGAEEQSPPATPAVTTAMRFAVWLCGQDDPTADAVVEPEASATDVARARSMGINELAARFRGARALAVVTYAGVPKTLASDLSQQIKLVDDLPAADLRALVLAGDKTKHADEVASEWMTDVLGIKGDEPTGVIVLWHADPVETASLTDAPAPPARLVMIAFKLTTPRVGSGTPVRVVRIAYVLPGEPSPLR